jgi:hypothetical protein
MIYLFTVSPNSETHYKFLLNGDYFYYDNTIFIFDIDNDVYGRDYTNFSFKEVDNDTLRPYIDISSKVYRDDNICSYTEAIALLNSTILNKILESI